MQYQHGGSRSRMPPFARGGGAYNRGQKQFYPPPPPPTLLAAALPPPPLNKYEVLMEAGRLAAEYLVAKGVLPPATLQLRGGGVAAGGWGQLPPPPPLPAAQDAPVYRDARNGRRRADDEYNNTLNARSRRNRGGGYNSRSSSNYNGRGKRKFGSDNRCSDWRRDRERSRGYSDSRSYDDDDDEDGAPEFRRQRRGSAGIDEVGSSVSGVAGEGPASKVEAMGESELEDTGSKVSSKSNIRQNADAPQEVEDESEANKMQEDSMVSNSEVVEQALNGEGNSNDASSGVVQEAAAVPVPSDEKVSDGRPEDSSVLNEEVEDDKTSDEKAEDDTTSDEVLIMETDSRNDSRHLLNYCSFSRIPTRPRSVLAHRNEGPAQREIAAAEQIDPISSEEVSRISKDALVGQEHADLSTACNQVAESVTFYETESQGKTEKIEEHNNIPQHNGFQDEHNELPPALASRQNNLRFQVEKGIQICNTDTPPQDEDEELIDSSDKGKAVAVESLPNIEAEAVITTERGKADSV